LYSASRKGSRCRKVSPCGAQLFDQSLGFFACDSVNVQALRAVASGSPHGWRVRVDPVDSPDRGGRTRFLCGLPTGFRPFGATGVYPTSVSVRGARVRPRAPCTPVYGDASVTPFAPPAFPLVWSEGPALKGSFVNGRERTILSLAQDAKSCAKVCAGLRPMCTELGPQVEPQTVAGAEGGVCTLARAPRVAHPTRSRP